MRSGRPAVVAAAHARHRLLAQIAAPELAGYTLEKLAAWLGVDVADRHSALGDAATTARIFLALVPKLREHGIRTVAEAERACRALTSVLDDQVRAAGSRRSTAPARVDAERTLERFDSYAYPPSHRDIMRTPRDLRAADAIGRCRAGANDGGEDIGRLCRPPAPDRRQSRRADAGIVTERDVLRAIAAIGAAALAAAGRGDHEPAAGVGSGGRVRLSRDRPHEPSQDPPSRRRRRGRQRGRCIVGARPAAPAGRRGHIARRRDRSMRRRTRAGGGLGEAAAGRGIAAGGRTVRPRHRRSDLARTRRAHPAGRRDCGAVHAGARPWAGRHVATP